MRVGTERNENYVRRDLDKMADRKVGSCHLFLICFIYFYLLLFLIFICSKEITKESEFMLQVLLYILFLFFKTEFFCGPLAVLGLALYIRVASTLACLYLELLGL